MIDPSGQMRDPGPEIGGHGGEDTLAGGIQRNGGPGPADQGGRTDPLHHGGQEHAVVGVDVCEKR